MDHEAVDNALRAAVEHGEIVEWTGEDGARRLTPAEPETLKRAVREIDDWEEPNTDQIGRLNTRIQELQADDV